MQIEKIPNNVGKNSICSFKSGQQLIYMIICKNMKNGT